VDKDKRRTLRRGGAACLAAGLTAMVCAMNCAALEENEIVLPGSETEDYETYESGDYVYSIYQDAEDETKQAACIEAYNGSEAELVIPSELDGLPVVLLGDYAFVSNHSLVSVTIPASVMGFGNFTFANCTNIEAFLVEEGSEYWESRDGVLYTADGSALMRYPIALKPSEVVIEEGVVGIGNVAFASCYTMTSVTFPDSLEYIGYSAFSDCTSLTEITIPAGVTEIPEYGFNSCSNLTKVTLHDDITSIGAAAFAGTKITEITLPAHCTTIGQQAFADTKLTEVTIPAAVTAIGYSAFGWIVNAYGDFVMDDAFIVRGYTGTIAETYCTDAENGNSFTFAPLDEPEDGSESELSGTTTQPLVLEDTEAISGGRLAGIIGSAAAIAAILIFSIVSFAGGKKKRAKQEEDDA